MALRGKIIAAIIAASVVTVIVAALPMLFSERALVAESGDQKLDQIRSELGRAIDAEIAKATSLASIVAGMPVVQDSMAAGDQETLINLFVPGFKEMKSKYGVAQFQFHLPPATSFLRVHKPEKHGDDLSGFRRTVVTANTAQQVVSGLERGRAGLGIRGVVPITRDGAHLGTIEFGLKLNDDFFKKMIAGSENQIEYYAFPDANIATFSDADAESIRAFATIDMPALLDASTAFRYATEGSENQTFDVGGVAYRSTFAPITDFAGNVVGLVHLMVPIEAIKSLTNQMMRWTLLGGAIAVTLGGIFAFFFGSRLTGALTATIGAMRQLADGDTEIDLSKAEGQSGEIGEIADALSTFRHGLIERERLARDERAAREAAAEAEEERLQLETKAREDRERRQKAEQEAKQQEDLAKERARTQADAERAERERALQLVLTLLGDGMQRLAEGDLRVRIDEVLDDQYEPLRQDFNETADALEALIRSISGSALTISVQAKEMTQAATDLSRRTEASAATLTETSAAIDQFASSASSAAEGAQKADTLVSSVADEAEKSSGVVDDAVSAMHRIEEKSQQISNIVNVIEEIAFQTNLLALNAGVEAARAGDAGSGFAVVASEVRALAQRSSEAAGEISTLIGDANTSVAEGVDLVSRAGVALGSIKGRIQEVKPEVKSIATGAVEQSSSVTEINSAVADLEQSTQQNAAVFEETSAATQVLQDAAEVLTTTVQRFEISDDDSRRGAEANVTHRAVG